MDKEKDLPKRKDLRLKHYDYSSAGAYFVTICTKDRKRILSNIIKPSVGVGTLDDPLNGFLNEPQISQIQLTEIGKVTEKYLLSSENIPGVKIDRHVIMPDHIHVIIFLYPDKYTSRKDGSSRAPTPTNEMLPHIVSTFKRFCNQEIGNNIFNADIWSILFVIARTTKQGPNTFTKTLYAGITTNYTQKNRGMYFARSLC